MRLADRAGDGAREREILLTEIMALYSAVICFLYLLFLHFHSGLGTESNLPNLAGGRP